MAKMGKEQNPIFPQQCFYFLSKQTLLRSVRLDISTLEHSAGEQNHLYKPS